MSQDPSTTIAANWSDIVDGEATLPVSSTITSAVNVTDITYQAQWERETDWFEFIVEGLLLLIISLIGCVCNVFAIIGLTRNKTRSFTKLLVALAIYDLLYLVMGIAIFGLPALSTWYTLNIYIYVVPISYGLAHIGRFGSVLLTVSVTIERYISVCHPMRRFKAKRMLLPAAVILSVVYNIPKFFEVKTDFENKMYVVFYLFWSKFLLVELIPYMVLIVLNFLIWRRVKALVKMRNECGIEAGPVHQDEIDLAWILIPVVSIFIFCQSFTVIPDTYEAFSCHKPDNSHCEGTWAIEHIIDLSHCSLAINSSINFFIYFMKGGKFREVILQMFRDVGTTSAHQAHKYGPHYEMVVMDETRDHQGLQQQQQQQQMRMNNMFTHTSSLNGPAAGPGQVAVNTIESPCCTIESRPREDPRTPVLLVEPAADEEEDSADDTGGIQFHAQVERDDDSGVGGEGCDHPVAQDAPADRSRQLRWPFTMYDMKTIEEDDSCDSTTKAKTGKSLKGTSPLSTSITFLSLKDNMKKMSSRLSLSSSRSDARISSGKKASPQEELTSVSDTTGQKYAPSPWAVRENNAGHLEVDVIKRAKSQPVYPDAQAV